MTTSGGGSKGVQQVDDRVKSECQRDVNGFVGNGPGLQEDNELRSSKVDSKEQNGFNQVALHGNAPPQAPPQLPQGSLVHWEKFLHVRSIKVLLVENDDCTRHIVTALLRNCNYEGVGLLCKIMNHKTRKNVPVIMMSSHDSMGLVFKCLSKGAVDFLVKPIRKNELKNLWQHVWRRCHSSSGSGSESGTQAQKSVNSKSKLRYDNSDGKDVDDSGSTDGGSDDGSGTQSSWTKQGVNPESPASPCIQIVEHPDSTCGLVIRPTKDFYDEERHFSTDNGGMAKEIARGRSKNSDMQIEFPNEVTDQVFDLTSNVKCKEIEVSDVQRESPLNIQKTKSIKMLDPCMENREIEGQGEPETMKDAKIKIIDDSNGVMVGEVGLKRPRAAENDGREVQNGCNFLRHSELSAFTRYKTNSNAVKGTPGITASCFVPDNESNIVMKESKRNARSDGYLIYQGSSEQVIPKKADGIAPADVPHQELHIQHIHHHHHVHHYHNIDTEQPLSNPDDIGLNKLAAGASHCGSSNIKGGPVEGNIENYSLNRNGSGSKHGSNVQNGSNTALNYEVTNVESNVGIAEESCSGSGKASCSGNADLTKSALREAALTKFRQKREVRCFQKKVRYQNRKKLAEQRPRVRGQFVKGKSRDSSVNAGDS
uniref:two-component response regulator-like APRR7 isoform X2 n=1 Tax=Erigeron canadensis TaxID=72917 RepID=UPI001CB92AD7|nr:two-component response regulator-like APRR7 isoform X2 [Erigeron canadensis]